MTTRRKGSYAATVYVNQDGIAVGEVFTRHHLWYTTTVFEPVGRPWPIRGPYLTRHMAERALGVL